MTECSVIRLPVKDVDRRLLRQVLNKLRGKHNKELDSAEYLRIFEQGEKEDLKALLESIGEDSLRIWMKVTRFRSLYLKLMR